MKKIALYVLILLTTTGCFSSKPDCDDVSLADLERSIKGYWIEKTRNKLESKRDSIKAAFKEAGFQFSILPPENPGTEYDSLETAFYTAMATIDTLVQIKIDRMRSITDEITVKETGELVSENTEMGLSTFHCQCKGRYFLREKSASFKYQLTRHDFDSRTYREVYLVDKAW